MQAECTASSKPPSQGTTQRVTHGHSLPPLSTITMTAQPLAETQTATRTSRKRGYSEASDSRSQGSGQQHTRACKDDSGIIGKSLPAGSQAQNLEAIRESDEDQLEDGTQPMDDDQGSPCQRTTPVMYTWSPPRPCHDTALNEDSNKSNSSRHRSDDSDSSDDDSDESVEILEPRRKPTVHPGKKGAGQKPSNKSADQVSKGNDGSESDINSSDDDDPETCRTCTAYTLTWEVSH